MKDQIRCEVFMQARQMNHQKNRLLLMSSAQTRSIEVNSSKIFLLFVVLLVFNDLVARDRGQEQQQVHAARLKGVIYNKNGKFIYRPSRSSQAHIIIIDDRSPKKGSHLDDDQQRQRPINSSADNQVDQYHHVNSSIGQNPSLQMIPSSSRFAPIMKSLQSVIPFHLVNFNDGHSADNSIAHGNGRIHDNAAQPVVFDRMASQTSSNALSVNPHSLTSYRMVPIVQLIPHSGSLPIGALMPAPLSYDRPLAAGIAATAINMATAQQGQQKLETATATNDRFLLNPTFQTARESLDYDSPGKTLPESYYRAQMASALRGPAGQLPDAYSDDLKQQQYLSMYPRPEPSFDEPLQQPLRNYQIFNSGPVYQPHQSQIAKLRRGGTSSHPMVQDLDDVEGDHIEYFEMGLGDKPGAAAGVPTSHTSQLERHSNRYHSRSPVQSSGLDTSLGGETFPRRATSRSLNGPQGTLVQLNQTQPLPASIQSIKSQLKRSNPGSNPTRSRSRKSSGVPTRDDETISLEPASGSFTSSGPARDPKSLQYWKQYQDQFDII